MRAWRDEGVANQVLEAEVLASGHESQSEFKSIYDVHLHANSKHIWRLLLRNACYVCEIPIAEKKCDHCPPNQRSNYHDFWGDEYQIQRDAYPTHEFLDTQKLVFPHFKVKAKAAISHNDQFLLECQCQHFP